MEKYGPPDNYDLKKELDRIDRNFRRSVAVLAVCAVIVVIALIKWFPRVGAKYFSCL